MEYSQNRLVIFARALAVSGFLTTATAQVIPLPLLHPDGTTHWYQVVTASHGVTWREANREAALAGGYLATVAFAKENDHIFSLVDDPSYWALEGSGEWHGPWLGGLRDPATSNPATGWRWAFYETFPFTLWTAGKPGVKAASGVNFGGSTVGRTRSWTSSDLTAKRISYVIEYSGARAPQTVGLQLHTKNVGEGYTLFSPLNSKLDSKTTFMIDSRGRVVRSWTSAKYAPTIAYLLPNGNLLRLGWNASQTGPGQGATGFLEEFSWQGTSRWSFSYSTATYLGHHDIEPLPNGNILLIAWEIRTLQEAVAAGFNPALLPKTGAMWPDKIVEIQPVGSSGRVVWEWHAWDHLIQDHDSTKKNYGVVGKRPELIDANYPPGGALNGDWMHSNSIDYHPTEDQILLSVRAFSEVWVIDHSTTTAEAASHSGGRSGKGGDLLYRWGNPVAYRAGAAKDQRLFMQHDAQWILPGLQGAGNILVFSNGNGRGYSSVEEFVPPKVDAKGNYPRTTAAFGPANPTWSYAPLGKDRFFAPFISSCQRLANGNTLVCDGPAGRMFEINTRGEQVWRYENPVGSTAVATPQGGVPDANYMFRATRIASDHPGLRGQTLVPGEPLEPCEHSLLVEGARLPVETKVGSRVTLSLRTEHPGWGYQLATSVTPGLVEFNDRFLSLGEDPLLWASMSNARPTAFLSYTGTLDFRGNASATIAIPNLAALAGFELLTGFIAFNVVAPAATAKFSNTVATKIVR